jgi:hypothetical protein
MTDSNPLDVLKTFNESKMNDSDALNVFKDFCNNKTEEKSDFLQYRSLLTKKFKKDQYFDVQTFVLRVSKKFKFVFYENGVKKEDCLDFNFVNDSRRDAFVKKLMKISRKKEEEYRKKGWTFNAIDHMYLNGFFLLNVLSAYLIEKNEDEADKEMCVDNFELKFENLLNDLIFIKYCENFNEDAKDNNFDLCEN